MLNIITVVLGFVFFIMIGAVAVDCLNSYSNSKGELKKAWKLAFEGWALLFVFIALDLLLLIIN